MPEYFGSISHVKASVAMNLEVQIARLASSFMKRTSGTFDIHDEKKSGPFL